MSSAFSSELRGELAQLIKRYQSALPESTPTIATLPLSEVEVGLLKGAANDFSCSPSEFLAAWIEFIASHQELLSQFDTAASIGTRESDSLGDTPIVRSATSTYLSISPELRQEILRLIESGRAVPIEGVGDSYNLSPNEKG
ncbi:MAG TPA: hypothetical protein VMH86_06180 [Rhizomicrobium sp.]|nr:hypothetical protein [Rhizomicrobium sp.]